MSQRILARPRGRGSVERSTIWLRPLFIHFFLAMEYYRQLAGFLQLLGDAGMHTWRSHLASVLERSARSQAGSPLRTIERSLCDLLDAESVSFCNAAGEKLPDGTTLGQALAQPMAIQIRVAYDPAERSANASSASAQRSRSRFVSDSSASSSQLRDLSPAQRRERFIRDLDDLERRHEFMWAGFVVKQMLPHLGLTVDEARQYLDQLQADNVVSINKVPNPKNPEYPATGVSLNRENPQVLDVLKSGDDNTEQTVPADEEKPATVESADSSG
ncbi:MAG: hypothetical protein KKB50_03215 [Planctomycetes bacterium]|nr:hypothetical protein [Planctomycetota bacterium]